MSATKTLERNIEKYFIKQIKALGGEHRKLSWVNRAHAPDRVVFYKGNHYIEMKRPGKGLRPGQEREHARMEKHQVAVWVINTTEQVDEFILFLRKLK